MIHLTINVEQEDPRALSAKQNGRGTLCSVEGIKQLLSLLKKYNVKATFFVTGFFAEQYPDMVTRMVSEKHEVACNGYNYHYKNKDKISIREDIEKAKKILEEVANMKVVGFRAPQMVYLPEVLEPLEKGGFSYDSTLQSAWLPRRYNHKLAPLKPFYPLRAGPFLEIPLSGSPRLRLPLDSPMIRLLGSSWLIKSCRRLHKENVSPVLSLNSWEFHPVDHNELSRSYLRNTGPVFLSMIEKLLQAFPSSEFATLAEILPTVPVFEALGKPRRS